MAQRKKEYLNHSRNKIVISLIIQYVCEEKHKILVTTFPLKN